jgi:hypothetical protein
MWKNGDRVLARREPEEDYWYPGTIRHSQANRHFVLFDDGGDALVGPSGLRPLSLELGDGVFVRRSGRDYEPGRITDREGDLLLIAFKSGGQPLWTPLARIRLGSHAARQGRSVPSWDVADRVLACYFDLDWYPGIVLRADDTKVHVLFDDGNQAIVTPDRVRPMEVSAGDRVLCRWQGRPEFYPGEVTHVKEEKIHVRYDDGDEEWTSVRLLRLQRDDWLAVGELQDLSTGDRVLARWFDQLWYPGVILAVEGKRIHIAFDDGDQAHVTCDQVRALDVGVGDHVSCRRRGGPFYLPGEILKKEGERICVRYDGGDEEWTSVRMVRVER